MATESDFEKDCRELAEAMGWVVYKGVGVNGAPDKIYLKDGRGWTAEKKTPDGQQSFAQMVEQARLKKKGVPYYLVSNLKQFKDAILEQEILRDEYYMLKKR